MKKIILGTIAASFLFSSAAFAVCDVQQATLEFSQFMQDLAAKDPQKVMAVQEKITALNNDIPGLVQSGKVDEICKRYDDIKASAK